MTDITNSITAGTVLPGDRPTRVTAINIHMVIDDRFVQLGRARAYVAARAYTAHDAQNDTYVRTVHTSD